MQEPSTIEKARVGRRRVQYYYPFRDCLRKCFPRFCWCSEICGQTNSTTAAIEETENGETFVSPLVKYALFIVNVLFWLGGLLLIAVGSWALATKELDGSKRVTSAWDFIFDVTIIFIIVGCMAFVLASCGCIGALRENVCLLKTYWLALILIDLILLIIGIGGLCMWPRFLATAKSKLSKELVINYDDDPDFKDLMDFVQEKFECCGISDESYLDWNRNIYFNCTTLNKDPRSCGVPHSCCRPEIRFSSAARILENYNCGFLAQTEPLPKAVQKIYTIGCIEAMESSIKKNILLFCLVSLGLSLIPLSIFQLIGICLSLSLSSQIEDQRAAYEFQEERRRRNQHQICSQ